MSCQMGNGVESPARKVSDLELLVEGLKVDIHSRITSCDNVHPSGEIWEVVGVKGHCDGCLAKSN